MGQLDIKISTNLKTIPNQSCDCYINKPKIFLNFLWKALNKSQDNTLIKVNMSKFA